MLQRYEKNLRLPNVIPDFYNKNIATIIVNKQIDGNPCHINSTISIKVTLFSINASPISIIVRNT